MTFPRTISLTSSVYSEARDAGYDDLEFALPERTALFVLGRHLLGERRKLIHLHFYSFFFLSVYSPTRKMKVDLYRAFVCYITDICSFFLPSNI